MTLAARCPSCKTAFKIPDTILQKQNGLVRCANCSHVFNAYENAIDLSKVIKTVRKPKPNSSSIASPTLQETESATGMRDQGDDSQTSTENSSQNYSRQSKLAKLQQNFSGQNNPLTEAIRFEQDAGQENTTQPKRSNQSNVSPRFNEGADELKKALAQLNQSKAYQDTQGVQSNKSSKSTQNIKNIEDVEDAKNNYTAENVDVDEDMDAESENLAEASSRKTRETRENRKKQAFAANLENFENAQDIDASNFDEFEASNAASLPNSANVTNVANAEKLELQSFDKDTANEKSESSESPTSTNISLGGNNKNFAAKTNQWLQKIEVLGEAFAQKVSSLVYGVENLFSKKKKEPQTQKNLDLVLDSWQQEQKKRNRNLLILSLFFLLLLLGTIFWQRNQIITNMPSAYPFFKKICGQLKCEIKPLEMSNNPVISYSDMQKDMSLASNRYIMNIGLKNKENLPAAMPFLEISLFDLNEQMIARRIFHPQEFLKADDWQRVEKSGMVAEEELPVKIRFQIQQAVSSFKVTAFYQ